MIKHQNVYLPDGEKHLVEWMTGNGEIVDGRGTYQIKKLRAALEYCTSFRTAVDIGAHVGLWSMQLEKRFYSVHAFEPVAAHRECFVKNLKAVDVPIGEEDASIVYDSEWVKLHPCALGDHEDMVEIKTEPTSSGDSRVDKTTLHACALGEKEGTVKLLVNPAITCKARVTGAGSIPMLTLDSFALTEVDFIKIDTEGFELFIIRGGEETIKRCRPTMIVEQKGHGVTYFNIGKTAAVEQLEAWGYRRVKELAGDYIMVPA